MKHYEFTIIWTAKLIVVSYMYYRTWSKCYDGGHRCKKNKKSHVQPLFSTCRELSLIQKWYTNYETDDIDYINYYLVCS